MRLWLPILVLASIMVSAGTGRADQPAPASSPGSFRPLRLHFTRHAETVANRTGVYNSRNLNVLSDEGELQTERLTRKLLEGPRFDRVCVSPVPRAQKTILPYLRKTGQVAQVWPALAECCWQKDHRPSLSARLLEGRPVSIPPELSSHLTLDGAPSTRWYDDSSYSSGLLQVRRLVDQIRETLGGSGLEVLMVGHSGNGSHMLELLMGREPAGKIKVDNAEPTVLEENRGGTFRLLVLNGRRVGSGSPRSAADR